MLRELPRPEQQAVNAGDFASPLKPVVAQARHAVAAIVLTAMLSLVAGRDLARQDAEFVHVPITDEHFDRGQYFLTVASSLVITSPLAQQMIEQIDGFPIRIVSHDPTPSYNATNFRPNRGG